jgi:GNAT superfamily N-acetyltransferase
MAKAIAFNLRKLVTRRKLAVVVATASDDLEADLRPDTIVRLAAGGEFRVEEGAARTDRPSFRDCLRIERGSLRDYAEMARMHYRHREQERVGCVDRVFVIRDSTSGELMGVVVYGHPPLELALRNRATGGRFIRNAGLLNREVRILRRLIVHPDVRGCGLGHWLVAETLGQAGTRYVECLSSMGLVNPVFEKAGMERVGLCSVPKRTERAVRELKAMGVDPMSADFPDDVCRKPRVRRIVARAVFDWYRAGTRGASDRVAAQGPASLARMFRQLMDSRPVYYLWSQDA